MFSAARSRSAAGRAEPAAGAEGTGRAEGRLRDLQAAHRRGHADGHGRAQGVAASHNVVDAHATFVALRAGHLHQRRAERHDRHPAHGQGPDAAAGAARPCSATRAAASSSAIGGLQRATVAQVQRARPRPVPRSPRCKAAAAERQVRPQRRRATRCRAQAAAQQAQLQSTLASEPDRAVRAQLALATLNNQRTTYVAYQAEQARLARIRAAKRRRPPGRSSCGRARRARPPPGPGATAVAVAVAEAARGAVSYSPPAAAAAAVDRGARPRCRRTAPRRRSACPTRGPAAAPSGPTYGVCEPATVRPNDCNVDGYDCSGLVMYAWGRNWLGPLRRHPVLAGRQLPPEPGQPQARGPAVLERRRHRGRHPPRRDLQRQRQIIQAPYSGGYIQVSSMVQSRGATSAPPGH